MKKKYLYLFLILFIGVDVAGQGLHYFIAGKHYYNTDLRNYAVIGQIILGMAAFAYGIWYYKKPAMKMQ
jgi:hypothetical protein